VIAGLIAWALMLAFLATRAAGDRTILLRDDHTWSDVNPQTQPTTLPVDPPPLVDPGPASPPPPPPPVTQPVNQPAPIGGQTIFAGPADDWGALAKAARDGDTLALPRNGQWKGILTVTSAVSVVSYGEGSKPVILAPANAPAVFVAPGAKLASLTLRDLVCRPADPGAPRNEGIAIYGSVGTVLVEGCESAGFEQGAVFVGDHGGVTLRSCWIHDTWADVGQPGKQFRGQNLYLDLPPLAKPTVIDHCLLSNAGTAGGRKPYPYAHNLYSQHDGPGVVITDSVFAGASAGAFQVRDGGSATRCVAYDAGAAVLTAGKPFTLKDSLVVGGHRYWTSPTQGGGNMGVCTYSLVTLDDVRFLGVPGQAAGNAPGQFDMGCLMASRTYPPAESPPTAAANAWARGGYPGRIVFASPCVARGWPGATASGDAAPKIPDPKLTVRSDVAPLTWLPQFKADLAAGRATAAQALKAQGVVN
jgi:hypothetical protein